MFWPRSRYYEKWIENKKNDTTHVRACFQCAVVVSVNVAISSIRRSIIGKSNWIWLLFIVQLRYTTASVPSGTINTKILPKKIGKIYVYMYTYWIHIALRLYCPPKCLQSILYTLVFSLKMQSHISRTRLISPKKKMNKIKSAHRASTVAKYCIFKYMCYLCVCTAHINSRSMTMHCFIIVIIYTSTYCIFWNVIYIVFVLI